MVADAENSTCLGAFLVVNDLLAVTSIHGRQACTEMRLLVRLRSTADAFRTEIVVYKLVCQDRRVPKPAKWLVGIAVAYALSPIDLIPDFIPILGYLDDVFIVPILIFMARKMIPQDVIDDCRRRAEGTGNRQLFHSLTPI